MRALTADEVNMGASSADVIVLMFCARKMSEQQLFITVVSRVFTKVAFVISRKSKFYTKMGLISRNFESFFTGLGFFKGMASQDE